MIVWCLAVVGMGRKGVFIVSFALTALTEAPIGRRAPRVLFKPLICL